jgi:homoserine O-acetyltransferase
VDISLESVIGVLDRGHEIFQGDIDRGLAMIPDGAYDYAVLSETLQEVRNPLLVLREMLRVARQGIVSFPNFARWSHRVRVGFAGRMPMGGSLPYQWYETPNIHLFTLKDFVALCRQERIRITHMTCLPGGVLGRLLVGLGLPNLGADRVLVKLARETGGAGVEGRSG